MSDIFVVVEHRQGTIRDITWEMLGLARSLSRELSGNSIAVLLGSATETLAKDLADRADRVLVMDDEQLRHFDGFLYQEVLAGLIREYRPLITFMGQTYGGMDLAPGLAVKTGYPLATDGVAVELEQGRPRVLRQIFAGKAFSQVSFRESPGFLVTIRPGAFPNDPMAGPAGEIIRKPCPPDLPVPRKRFLEFIESEAGEVDIAQAEFLVSVGRGVEEAENLSQVKDLARSLNAALSCSRPVVDKKWLPKYHQVGTSGKSVKPKVYLALGISGAFQHLAGISGAGTIIAVNKDPRAPIFRAAHYGVVEDMFKIIPALMEKLKNK